MDRYKKKPLNFSMEISGREIRAHRLSISRRDSRHIRLSSFRNIEPFKLEDSFKEPEPVQPKVAAPNPRNDRLQMLKKWKEEKELRKKLQDRSKKPPFVVPYTFPKPGQTQIPQVAAKPNKTIPNVSRIATNTTKSAIAVPRSINKQCTNPKITAQPKKPNPIPQSCAMATRNRVLTNTTGVSLPAPGQSARNTTHSVKKAPSRFDFNSTLPKARDHTAVTSRAQPAEAVKKTIAPMKPTKAPIPSANLSRKEASDLRTEVNCLPSFAPENFEFQPFSLQSVVLSHGISPGSAKSFNSKDFEFTKEVNSCKNTSKVEKCQDPMTDLSSLKPLAVTEKSLFSYLEPVLAVTEDSELDPDESHPGLKKEISCDNEVATLESQWAQQEISQAIGFETTKSSQVNAAIAQVSELLPSMHITKAKALIVDASIATPKRRSKRHSRPLASAATKENVASELDTINENGDTVELSTRACTNMTVTPDRPLTRLQQRKLSLLGSPQLPEQGQRKSIRGDLITFSPNV